MSQTKLTYLLGAGASYHATPIEKELCERMIFLAQSFLDKKFAQANIQRRVTNPSSEFRKDNPYQLTDSKYLAHEIGHFGVLGKRYHTIDKLAQKFYNNNDNNSLSRLKIAVSTFFAIWQLTVDSQSRFKNESNNSERNIEDIFDQRYLDFFNQLVSKSGENIPMLYPDVNIVSWNYDLQLQLAYKSYVTSSKLTWHKVAEFLPFQPKKSSPMKICHLNGYCGYYNTDGKEVTYMDRNQSEDILEVVEAIAYLHNSQKNGSIEFDSHINYAFEKEGSLAKTTRQRAKTIFNETDVLVIIGYSFPRINRDVDMELFKSLKIGTKVIYQDPSPSPTFKVLEESIGFKADIITSTDAFHIPYNIL